MIHSANLTVLQSSKLHYHLSLVCFETFLKVLIDGTHV